MAVNIKGRSLLSLKDFTREAEIEDDITFVGLRVVK